MDDIDRRRIDKRQRKLLDEFCAAVMAKDDLVAVLSNSANRQIDRSENLLEVLDEIAAKALWMKSHG